MNLNQLAKAICKIEGGKVNLSIAQVKEVINCLAEISVKNPFILDTIYELGLYHAELVSKVSATKSKPTPAPVRNRDTGKAPKKDKASVKRKKPSKGELVGRKSSGAKAGSKLCPK